MSLRHLVRKLRYFDYADLRFLYIACLATIAFVYSVFRVSQHFLNQQRNDTLRALESIEHQRDSVSELERLIVMAQNLAATDYRNRARNLLFAYGRVIERHGQMLKLSQTLRSNCAVRPCAEFLVAMPLKVPPSQLASDLVDPRNHAVKHMLLMKRLYAEASSYHKALSDGLSLSIELISSRDHAISMFDVISYICLLVLLVIQALYIFRPAIQRLNDSLSTRSEFLSRISHEIRNPMNSVLGMADILKGTRLNYEQQQYVDNMIRSGQALLDMLNNLVDFSSIEGGKLSLKDNPFHLFTSLDRCVNLISIPAHHKNLNVYLCIAPNVVNELIGDSVRLEQVLINLLNNATKFTEQGHIRLTVDVESETENATYLRFTVADTGIGIRPEQQGEIFDSFVQGDSSIQRKYGGSGLGLSISSELIRLMGGDLKVQSVLGKGSDFFFTIEFVKQASLKDPRPLMKLSEGRFIFMAAPGEIPPYQIVFEHAGAGVDFFSTAKELGEHLVSVGEELTELLIDDSVGIISMINCRNLAEEHGLGTRAVALIRSNFTKENMDLLRRNGFTRFLIKPLKPWGLLEIPVARQTSEEFPRTSTNPTLIDQLRQKNLRMLLVDDSNDNLFLLREVVQPLATTIHFAENGLEAIEKFKANEVDVIFMDIQMPVMDGYTAIRKIREIEDKGKRQPIPIYAVTAHAGLVDAQKCREAGFTDRIVKPVMRTDIYQQLSKSFSLESVVFEDSSPTLPEKYLAKLIPTYLKTRLEDMVKLQSALENSDFRTIGQLGHKIKGSAASYGFPKVSDASHELESAAQKEDLERCTFLADELDKMFRVEREKQNL